MNFKCAFINIMCHRWASIYIEYIWYKDFEFPFKILNIRFFKYIIASKHYTSLVVNITLVFFWQRTQLQLKIEYNENCLQNSYISDGWSGSSSQGRRNSWSISCSHLLDTKTEIHVKWSPTTSPTRKQKTYPISNQSIPGMQHVVSNSPLRQTHVNCTKTLPYLSSATGLNSMPERL